MSAQHIIEEQLQYISNRLKEIENSSTSSLFELYKTIKAALQSIGRQQIRTKAAVLQALVEYEPRVVQAFADNHVEYQRFELKILDIANALLYSIAPLEKATLAAALVHYFNKYNIAIHETLSKEEATLLPLLYRYYNEQELTKIQMSLEQVSPILSSMMQTPEPILN